MRFDVPVVGLPTLSAMQDAGATVLSIDAERTLVLDGDKLYAEADVCGVTIVGRARGPS